jgi:hypothetical protein
VRVSDFIVVFDRGMEICHYGSDGEKGVDGIVAGCGEKGILVVR